MAIHDFDRSIVNVSIWFAQNLVVDRLIRDISVYMTKKIICKNYKRKAPLSNTRTVGKEVGNRFGKRKWDVEGNKSGLYSFRPDTSNKEIPHIFNITTPKDSLMHILYRYVICEVEIYHRKQMCSNIQGRIWLFYVHLMISKSRAGDSLNVVTRDIGLPNTLVWDNAGEHIRLQIELQEFIRCCCIDVRTTKP